MASPGKRRETDLMKLMMADYEVQMCDGDRVGEFYVKFHGPQGTPYEGGVWKVHVELPDAYPYKSPSIGFINRLYHPNVDEMSGSVCLDVINQTWSPMYDLVNIFEVFLPQLLTYPNPTDPLNGEAAALQMREPERYQQKVREYVQKYARPEDFGNDAGNDDDSDDCSFSESDSDDDNPAPPPPPVARAQLGAQQTAPPPNQPSAPIPTPSAQGHSHMQGPSRRPGSQAPGVPQGGPHNGTFPGRFNM